MKKMKKILAMLVTLAMIMGMTMTAMADPIAVPSGSDVAEIKVTGLPDGATVKAYQVVDATYDEAGFSAYVAVDEVTIADPTKPTAAEIAEIASDIPEELTPVTLAGNAANGYAANVGAGYWLIVVDPIDTNIYNPMLAGVYYVNEDGTGNTIEGGTVDSTGNWVLNGTTAHAKSSNTNINKVIVNPSTGNEKADDAAIGDDLTFKVTSSIPAYSKDTYKSATFKITDTLSEGLDFVSAADDVAVKVGGSEVEAGADSYTVTIDGKVLTVAFASDYIFDNGGKAVEITYQAELNEDALLDNAGNPNEVYLTYSHKPGDTTDTEEVITYHYAFDFNVIKVDDKNEVLEGATFTLTDAEGNATEVTSDENGNITFTGLDVGTYTLQETEAPDGYQLDSTVHNVVISATYKADGTMESYSITVDGDAIETLKVGQQTVDTAEITFQNTKLIELPSTGGMGTTIFTIGGCAIMIAAACLFFVSRRKEAR